MRFPCTKCDKTFAAGKNLREHNRFQHERHKYQPAFKCEFCGKTFFRKCNYDNHIGKYYFDFLSYRKMALLRIDI